jgi:hypothetical protein
MYACLHCVLSVIISHFIVPYLFPPFPFLIKYCVLFCAIGVLVYC